MTAFVVLIEVVVAVVGGIAFCKRKGKGKRKQTFVGDSGGSNGYGCYGYKCLHKR